MNDKSPDQLTLRQRLSECERMLADLTEHMDRGFLPKVKALRKLVRSPETDGAEIRDTTIRHHADDLIRSEYFTDDLFVKLVSYLTSIDHTVSEMISEQPTEMEADES